MKELLIKEIILLEPREKLSPDELEKRIKEANLNKGDFIRGVDKENNSFSGIYDTYKFLKNKKDRLIIYFTCTSKENSFVKCKSVKSFSKLDNYYFKL